MNAVKVKSFPLLTQTARSGQDILALKASRVKSGALTWPDKKNKSKQLHHMIVPPGASRFMSFRCLNMIPCGYHILWSWIQQRVFSLCPIPCSDLQEPRCD